MNAQVDTEQTAGEQYFTDREMQEINYCLVYYKDFKHGTDGHSWRILVAKMAMILQQNGGIQFYLVKDGSDGSTGGNQPE